MKKKQKPKKVVKKKRSLFNSKLKALSRGLDALEKFSARQYSSLSRDYRDLEMRMETLEGVKFRKLDEYTRFLANEISDIQLSDLHAGKLQMLKIKAGEFAEQVSTMVKNIKKLEPAHPEKDGAVQ